MPRKTVYIVKGCSDFYTGEKLFCTTCKKFSNDPKEDFYNDRKEFLEPKITEI